MLLGCQFENRRIHRLRSMGILIGQQQHSGPLGRLTNGRQRVVVPRILRAAVGQHAVHVVIGRTTEDQSRRFCTRGDGTGECQTSADDQSHNKRQEADPHRDAPAEKEYSGFSAFRVSYSLDTATTDTLRRETVGLHGFPCQKPRALSTYLPGDRGVASCSW
jgi:hypothetical protein